MQITFVGAGYVGLVSGAMLSFLGADVTCYDNDESKIRDLQQGKIPIYEPALDGYILKASNAGRLKFSSELDLSSDIVFIAVGTPPQESGEADLSHVYEATLLIAQNYSPDTLIVIKSTVPPGTCLLLESMLKEKGYGHMIANNPEFLREGSAIQDFLNPDRIVIGTDSECCAKKLSEVYKPLTNKGFAIVHTDPTTSELIKYASNSFLATKIGFINEMANLCEKVGGNIEDLSSGMGMDNRIGKAFLKAGPGFGGSCFPKDLLALSHLAKSYDQPCHILDAVIHSNKGRCAHMANKILSALEGLSEKSICVLGITFKAGTDDVRSSPAVDIIKLLLRNGVAVNVYDPEGAKNGKLEIADAEFFLDPYEASINADALVILTEWEEFTALNYAKVLENLSRPNLFDFRNILDGKKMKDLGYNYFRIGGYK